MKDNNQKTLEALKKAKEAVDQVNSALDAAIQELDDDALAQVTGGGEFDDVPSVTEHPYKDKDKPSYLPN